jgi:hypothetical protein
MGVLPVMEGKENLACGFNATKFEMLMLKFVVD